MLRPLETPQSFTHNLTVPAYLAVESEFSLKCAISSV